ncbi:hypothetical protein E2C01_021260 [Portunus trituberculatus]|uniref:Uncharacterized protein n=1 Tax=Portunus trituberculatus TaxID=210409 RepID=A0A5B7E4H5_PORTR|nr:hypothetical protein [Portunus trituberculatus]
MVTDVVVMMVMRGGVEFTLMGITITRRLSKLTDHPPTLSLSSPHSLTLTSRSSILHHGYSDPSLPPSLLIAARSSTST